MPQQEKGTTTRRRLIELLRTTGGCGIAELSGELGLTEMGVRRHLHRLERDGIVRSLAVRQAMGRPSYRYTLTESADDLFPKNYPHLTLELLGELEELSGPETVDRLFEGRRAKLEARYRDRMRGKPLRERVAELAAIQNAGGYMAVWETDPAGGYVLHERNCPIAQVANRYRQACSCEKALFAELLSADVERTECFADGGNRCTYAIRAAAASDEPK
ncbi:helix-turn-helix transcriptional regulator [Cohnella zeiphila]|uniref:Winged helix-turn-helix transcriptional regulator n=1 Tax=Cohnella zeiphila TaxID=2761120 RepID=A0A7X0VYS9_9BACL|nr:winged helix-turn-helix transcriptional regulator [Cohnella zeiphila]MBB6735040.1 winged helix-turn-helix transcriptional regulator [Cohnella zeiphila]